MINLILSAKAEDNSKYIYQAIDTRLRDNKKSILIVPEQYTLETDVEFLKAISYKAVMDAKVLSFSSFANFILDKFLESDMKFLNKEGKIMLLTNIIQDINDKLVLFKNAHTNVDFINNIVNLLSSFKENNFDKDFFEKIEEKDLDEATKIKFNEIKMLVDTYQKTIEGKFFDSEDIITFVASNIKNADFLKEYHFYFDKFDSMEDRKLDLIRALDGANIPIIISLNLDIKYINATYTRAEIFDNAYNFYKKLSENFKLDLKNIAYTKPALDIDHLLSNFESYNPQPYEGDVKNIYLLESISTRLEVENVAVLINKLIKGKNLAYKDIGLYISSGEEYENEIIKTFNRYQIPVFLDKRRKMADNHLVKTFLALIRLEVNNFRLDDLYYVINSKLIDFDPRDTRAFVNFLSYRKIKGSMFREDKYFEFDKDFYEKYLANDPKKEMKLAKKSEEYQSVARVRDKILNLLKALEIENPTCKDLATGIYEMISDKDIIKGITDFQENLRANSYLDDYRENEQIWDKFVSLLDQLVLIMGDRENSLARIYSLIEAVSKDIQIGLIPPSKDHLIVTDFARERVSNKKINIIMGLADAYFPSFSTNDKLISDDEKESLEKQGIDLKLYNKDLDEVEKLNLYKIISSSDKLYFSYSLSDKAGKELKASLIIRYLEKIFPKIKINSIPAMEGADAIYARESLKKYALNLLNKKIKKQNITREDEELALLYMNYLRDNFDDYENKKIYTTICKGLFYNNDKLPLAEDITHSLYKKNAFSVSEIETFSRCPYKHFVSYGLRPDVDKDFDVDNMEIGNIVHKSLEDLSRLIKNENLDDITDEKLDSLIEDNFKEGIDQNLDKTRKSSPRNAYILSNILNSSKRNAREIKKQLQEGDFKLEYFEEAFDKNGIFKPLYIDEKNYIRGRIDRIDRAGEKIRIIDYKTGSRDFKIVKILNGLDLQLIVYMMAVREDGTNLMPVASFYLPLKDEISKLNTALSDEKSLEALDNKFSMRGLIVDKNDEVLRLMDKDYDGKSIPFIDKVKENTISEEEFDKISKFTKNIIKETIDSIKKGIIDLRPVRESDIVNECTYCDYKGICKFDYIIDSLRYRDIDNSKTIEDLEVDGD